MDDDSFRDDVNVLFAKALRERRFKTIVCQRGELLAREPRSAVGKIALTLERFKADKIVVLIDLETGKGAITDHDVDRSARKIGEGIGRLIPIHGVGKNVAMENWVLGALSSWPSASGRNLPKIPRCVDGDIGALNTLKRYYRKEKGKKYQKTIHGPTILGSASWEQLKERSPSFANALKAASEC